MFLNPRLLSGSPTMVLIGLVFAAGMAAGAALQARLPQVAARGADAAPTEQRRPDAASLSAETERSAAEGRKQQAPSAPSPWKGEGRGGGQFSTEVRPGTPSLNDLRLANGGHPAEVLRVNDGDTFEARVHVWPGMQVTTKVRLRGIDAAEFNARCQEEHRLALAARDALQRLLAEGSVTIGQIGLDKYGGRVLATASTRTTPDISEALLKTGLVRPYEGGRRETWCNGVVTR